MVLKREGFKTIDGFCPTESSDPWDLRSFAEILAVKAQISSLDVKVFSAIIQPFRFTRVEDDASRVLSTKVFPINDTIGLEKSPEQVERDSLIYLNQ
jgi:hypothetical protein